MTSRPMRVCIVGHICIDENPRGSEPAVRTPGSPAVFIVGEYAGLAGIETTVLATHGTDFSRLSPGTPLATPPGRSPSLLYRNYFVDGRRRQECRNTQNAAPPVLDGTARRLLAEADVVIIAPLLDNFTPDYLAGVFAIVSPSALRVLLPQGYFRAVAADQSIHQADFTEHARILPDVDLVVFSDEDCTDALDRAVEFSLSSPRTRIVVTQGELGATCVEQGVTHGIAASPISSVDELTTIGAGDVFSAHLALACVTSRDLRSAVATANEAAASFLDQGQRRLSPTDSTLLAG
ncbi:PfkB family carbohydrate kinase [Subtercola sp. YIM 133946]|uniref:PfkB family carbohydrate kinase n=1 Tax=Subtercola sp. YIM 133946 TaxID=3118909 RepID=UPI002F9355D4